MNTVFVTGAAGFIGSNLCDALLKNPNRVIGWDNFSTGRREGLLGALQDPAFRLIEGDNLDLPALTAAMKGADFVFHLAANADVRFGLEHPSRDFDQNSRGTFNVLEAMRANGITGLAFASTGSIYGETDQIPTPEDAAFPVQTSLYGASKLAAEGFIQAYCEGFGLRAHIFRFVSILGPRYTHGHVFDFFKQLMIHPEYLDVLGDGSQRKSYLYVDDCVRAMLHVIGQNQVSYARHGVLTFNLGTNEYCTVADSIRWICKKRGVNPILRFSGGSRGWTGDNPFIFLDTNRVRQTGWKPELTIQAAVEATVDWLAANTWVFHEVHQNASA